MMGTLQNPIKKPRIIIFFEIFLRKFWHLVKLNLLFVIFNLPAFVGVPVILLFFWPPLREFYVVVGAILVFLPLVTVGPVQAGFTYILRNFAREEHAFLWWDFKEKALKNARQSIFICLIDWAVVIIIGMNINYYFSMRGGSILFTAMAYLMIVLLLLYGMMHLYIYPLLITFSLSIKQIYKNALIFSFLRFLPNLGILALIILLIVLHMVIFPLAGLFLFCFISFSGIGLITNFYVYPVLKRYMVDNLTYEGKSQH